MQKVLKLNMNSENHSLDSTISYYSNHAHSLIPSYESADMSKLHTTLLEYLTPSSKVMDIGFGSGRDLDFLQRNGFNIWGIDPSQEFVNHVKKRFPDIEDHFFKGQLPNLTIPKKLLHFFDNIILIAVWMHLPKEMYDESIKALCSLLNDKGKVVLSYSITPRKDENERYFENLDRNILLSHFEKNGFKRVAFTHNQDGLDNRDITWITEVYSYDKP